METYVLDKTFISQGSLGTHICVRTGLGTVPSDLCNRISTCVGSLAPGTILPLGVTQTGCSASGKEVVVRLLGISKVKLATTSGSIMQGKECFPSTKGKIRMTNKYSGTAHSAILGIIIQAEGKGSMDALASVLIQPRIRQGQ